MSESISIAIGLETLGIILEKAEFNEQVVAQSAEALSWVSNCFTLIPGICMILGAFIISKYSINKKNFNRILFGIERRKRGEKVDMKEFDDIF